MILILKFLSILSIFKKLNCYGEENSGVSRFTAIAFSPIVCAKQVPCGTGDRPEYSGEGYYALSRAG